jgi:PIN domain nuclease of toxin-antitoxin system
VKYLLDTHVFLWLQAQPDRLDPGLLARFERADLLLLSAASAWEIAIKHRLGKLPLPFDPAFYVPDRMTRSGIDGLAIEIPHVLAAGELPLHHRDPFDRLLIAQGRLLGVALVTADDQFGAYDVQLIRV